jgi:hypothetical protein
MKNTHIISKYFKVKFIVIFYLCFLFSCEKNGFIRESKWIHILKNETSHEIIINAYTKKVKQDSIKIAPHKSFKREFSEFETKFTNGIFFNEDFGRANNFVDSLTIDFSKKKRILYFCDNRRLNFCGINNKNPIYITQEENRIKDKKGNILFGYIIKSQISFTDEDYEKAIPL